MKKLVSLFIAAAMTLSIIPASFASQSYSAENVDAVRAMYFNSADELAESDGDNLLIASGTGWTCDTSFTDLDGTVTEQASLSGSNFNTPRNAAIAFELPDIDYDNLLRVTLSVTVKNVKQTSANQRIGVYGNSLKEEWTTDSDGKAALGASDTSGLDNLTMLGFTSEITTGNSTGESESNETVSISTKALLQYIKDLHEDGYSEVTFRLANSLGGIRIYDLNQTDAPTLLFECGTAASVTIKHVLENGEDFGMENDTLDAIVGEEFTYTPEDETIELNGNYYIYKSSSADSITPTEGENVITLYYEEVDGTGLTGSVLTEEGAQCWFADPRSLTYKNEELGINRTYVGYIDVHGSIKATQYDNNTGETSEVLIRSNFQPDDHDNPTFLALPDGRIMIFYSRHTDESCFYYRVSKEVGDITTLGEEKYLKTDNNTTYPSPFILSADPDHIYLCWRGINWHPTIAQLDIPDENGDTQFTWGPRQILKSTAQSSNCRPYAKYASNGVDKIMISYTATHPDNVSTNPLYFNYISIPDMVLRDIYGNKVSDLTDSSDLFTISGSEGATNYSVVDRTSNVRDWLWEVAIADDGYPVIAMVKIDSTKKNHTYYYVKFTGSGWTKVELPCEAGNTTMHTSSTEYCYSGGMSFDKANPRIIYTSMPVQGIFGKVWEIVRFTMNEDYTAIESMDYITSNSKENNVRPYVSYGSEEGDMRLTWMNGYYQYWMVSKSYTKGYPTRMMTLTDLDEPEILNTLGAVNDESYRIDGNTAEVSAPQGGEFTIAFDFIQSDMSVGGTFIESGDLKIVLEKQTVDPKKDYAAVAPHVYAGEASQKSDNLFSNSDWFASSVSGTNGDKGVNNMGWINYAVTYDGENLTTYVNGLIDATLQNVDVSLGDMITLGGIDGVITNVRTADVCLTQAEIKSAAEDFDEESIATVDTISLSGIDNVTSDLILPTSAYDGSAITWASSDENYLTSGGAVKRDEEPHTVTLTAVCDGESRDFTVTIAAKESFYDNLLFGYDFEDIYVSDGVTKVSDISGNGIDGELYGSAKIKYGRLDLTDNTATGFDTNGYMNVPYDILSGVRSYTVAEKVTSGTLAAPRIYDFGTGSSYSMFTRASTLAAGIKNSSTLYATSSAQLSENEQWLITTYDAATGETAIYLDGEKVMSTTVVTHEAYSVSGGTTRNYIGRTQWWDTSYAADNQDFDGTIDSFMFFNCALTEDEMAQLMASDPVENIEFAFDGETASVSGTEREYVIAVVQYDSDGALISIETTNAATLTIIPDTNAAIKKAFLWNKSTMEPLTDAIVK
ncbi:MAG: BNR-4 repeat-containing protein [Clostridia bacterium]|nr:BNR-4 repeat-containing protein [Clostridia bacterium]